MAVRLTQQSDRNQPSRGFDRQSILVGRRVIVVDDSPSQRRRLSEMFESIGMQVVGEAGNGLECLALADKTRPDVISLDVIMPIMHGVETLGYLRELKTTAVVIFVSAIGNLEVMSEIRSPGGHMPDAIFSKKDSVETFKEVLTAVYAGDDDNGRPPQSRAAADIQQAQTRVPVDAPAQSRAAVDEVPSPPSPPSRAVS